MKKVTAALTAALALAAAPTALAEPSESGACRQEVRDALVALSEEGTMGDFVSDGFYGNEPNELNGQTVPSQSPGPFVTNPDGSVRRGATWGEIQTTVIKPLCEG
jgi:hypothetical protein